MVYCDLFPRKKDILDKNTRIFWPKITKISQFRLNSDRKNSQFRLKKRLKEEWLVFFFRFRWHYRKNEVFLYHVPFFLLLPSTMSSVANAIKIKIHKWNLILWFSAECYSEKCVLCWRQLLGDHSRSIMISFLPLWRLQIEEGARGNSTIAPWRIQSLGKY